MLPGTSDESPRTDLHQWVKCLVFQWLNRVLRRMSTALPTHYVDKVDGQELSIARLL